MTGHTTLRQMAPFASAMGIPGPRACWTLSPAKDGSASVLASLEKRGLFSNNALNLNGWVYIDDQKELLIKNKTKVLANGGIVLKKGNIRIEHQIEAVPAGGHTPVLQLVTLEGDILINTNQTIDAALIAPKGAVRIGTSGRPTINGAMAMQTLPLSSASQGADLNYRPELATLPNATDPSRSEQPLLAFSGAPNLLILQ